MNELMINRDLLWGEFLNRWPIEHIRELTLDEYSQPGKQDGFTYWLEKKTEQLGSVWGGSSFKFGIYRRSDKSTAVNEKGRIYRDEYAWYSKYGDTPEVAFKNVRAEILKVIEASQQGDLATIDSINLGDAIKWKLAFLYQNRDSYCVLPIFKAEYLRFALDSSEKRVGVLQNQLMQGIQEKGIFEYADEIWAAIQPKIYTELTTEDAQHFFDDASDRFSLIKPATQKIAGYETNDGQQLALALDNKKTTLYLNQGDWLAPVESKLQEVVHYAQDKSRSSNLAANAPQLGEGNSIIRVVVPTMDALIALCDAYENTNSDEIIPIRISMTNTNFGATKPPLNQIFYGPPGTGKTFSTIDAALEIVDPDFLKSHPEIPNTNQVAQIERRAELKQRFDELVTTRQIRFVTFHQSFSYEDFVEGIRAVPGNEEDQNGSGTIEYQVENGIFVQLCEDAQRNKIFEEQVGVRENAKVWKISIEEANSSGETRQYCFKHGEARIGWPSAKDIRSTNLAEPALKLGTNEQSSLANFGRDIVSGDVLVCLGTISQICAVGIVTGQYEYTEQVPQGVRSDYVHKLPVKWLATDLKFDIRELNQGLGLTLKTVYLLRRIKWQALQDALHRARVVLVNQVKVPESSPEPYVLIIDEINRGNLSRVFGELITLIEPSKRANAEEALDTILPYSKKRFAVPNNVFLIGTMNTSDRSLAGLDIALRRRFTFREIPPKPELLRSINIDGVNLEQLMKIMNERIEVLMDRDHCLGHAYFITLKDDDPIEELAFIFRQKILPLLQEYFFEDWERIA